MQRIDTQVLGREFPPLTGVRALAAGLVLAYHFWLDIGAPLGTLAGYPLDALARCGYLGVDLFFVLSAFLLSQPFLAAAAGALPWPGLGRYAMRRVRRIVPALWIQLAILAAVGTALGATLPFDWRAVAATALFLQNTLPHNGTINPVYWSLPVEWWFYALIPPIAWLAGRTRLAVALALLIGLGVGFRVLCWHWLRSGDIGAYSNILLLRARLDEFALGIAAAWLHLRLPLAHRSRALAGGAAALFLLAFAPWLAARGDVYSRGDFPWLFVHYDVVGLAFAALVFGAAGCGPVARALLANRVALGIGTVSFSLYLWHLPVLHVVDATRLWNRGSPLQNLAVLGLVAGVAALSWRFTERPWLRPRARPVAERAEDR